MEEGSVYILSLSEGFILCVSFLLFFLSLLDIEIFSLCVSLSPSLSVCIYIYAVEGVEEGALSTVRILPNRSLGRNVYINDLKSVDYYRLYRWTCLLVFLFSFSLYLSH